MVRREVGRSRWMVACLCLVVAFSDLPGFDPPAMAKTPAAVEVPPLPSTVGRAVVPEVAVGSFDFEPPVTGQPGMDSVGPVIGPTARPSQPPSHLGDPSGRVEIIDERAVDRKVYANLDGTRTMKVFNGPVHTLDENGSWVDIDTNLVARAGGLVPRALGVDLRLGPTGAGSQMTVGETGQQVRVSFPGAANVAPVADGSNAVYSDVFPGVDLKVLVGSLTIKQLVVWRQPPASATVEMAVDVDAGLTPVLTGLGGVEFKDSEGAVIGSIAPPLVWDSNVNEESAEPVYGPVSFELVQDGTGWRLRIVVDEVWLADPARVFPVYVDPIWSWFNAGNLGDAYVTSAYPNNNYNAVWNGTLGYYEDRIGYYDATTGWNETFMHFDLRSLEGKAIYSAYLDLAFIWSYYATTPTEYYVRPVDCCPTWPNWRGDLITWNNKPPVRSPSVTGMGLRNSWSTVELTSWVQGWTNVSDCTSWWGCPPSWMTPYDQRIAGIRIDTGSCATACWKKIASLDNSADVAPYLEVTYLPTVSLVSPTNGSRGHSLTPTLQAKIGVPGEGNLFYRFYVCDDASLTGCYEGPLEGPVTAGTTVSHSVGSSRLPDHEYHWFVQASSESGVIGTSPVWTLRTNTPPPTSTLSAPTDGQVVSTLTPGFVGSTVTDADGDPVKYWFRVATGPDANSGQIVANSGWLTSPSWTVPSGALQDGLVYYVRVDTSDWSGVPQKSQTVGLVRSFKVDLRLGAKGPSPYDTAGPVSVNLSNGNLVMVTGSPSFPTVGGAVGLTFTYNSQAPSPAGLLATYYSDGDRDRLAEPGEDRRVRVDSTVDFAWAGGSPDPGVEPDYFIGVWTGYVTVPTTGSYQFGATIDDRVKITVNNTTVLDVTATDGPLYGAAVALTAGVPVPIKVEFWEYTGAATMRLYVKGAVAQQVVPASWLSTTIQPLPQGWSASADLDGALGFLSARVADSSVALLDATGAVHTYTWKNKGYTPPPGEDGVLSRNGDGSLTFLSPDGTQYEFGPSGELKSAMSPLDDRSPAVPAYVWSGSPARLTTIKDPVSLRVVLLRYGGDPACPTGAPAGFDTQAPPGMLCSVSYWDGTNTKLWYVSGLLARIEDPGSEFTDFGYDAGKLARIRDPLANDAITAGVVANDETTRTVIGYASGKVTSVTLPAPSAGAPRPGRSYTYTSGTETRVNVSGLTSPLGYARKVIFDTAGRTTSDTDATGNTTTYQWDARDLLVSTTDPANRKSTVIYDQAMRPVDRYGPALSSCFGTNNLPNGTCSPAVARTQSEYDGGITGLAAVYWDNKNLSGPPKIHDTVSSLNLDWGLGQPSGITPVDYWSGRFTGDITLPVSGTYSFRFLADDGVRLWIDDQLVVDWWGVHANWSPSGTFINTVAGSKHRIRVDYFEETVGASVRLYWTPPGATEVLVPGSNLSPRYGLPTKETVHDSTVGSPSRVTSFSYGSNPEYGLVVSSTDDPGGLNLVSQSSYEPPGSGFFRQTTRVLPAGNAWTMAYYGSTEIATNPCPQGGSANQAGRLRTRTGPDPDGTGPQTARMEEVVYDAAGRIVATRLGSEAWTCLTYDGRGRLTTKTIPPFGGQPGRTLTYSYSVGGDPRVLSVTDPTGSITTTVDLLGRVVSYTDVWGKTTTTTYDQPGRLAGRNGPVGSEVFTYDAAGRVDTETLDGVLVADTAYDGNGEVSSVSYGNGTSLTVTRDATRAGVKKVSYAAPGGGLLASDEVTRSQSGRVVDEKIDDVDPYTAGNNFVYDGAGRLTTARLAGITQTYGFATDTSCALAPTAGMNTNRMSMEAGGVASSYCYDGADRLVAGTGLGAVSYDAHGNTTALGEMTLTFDGSDRHMGQSEGETTVTYQRDGLDRVVSRTVTEPGAVSLRGGVVGVERERRHVACRVTSAGDGGR